MTLTQNMMVGVHICKPFLFGLPHTANQIESNQSDFFYMIFQVSVYTNKNKMAKYLQWKIMCGETTCKKTLYMTTLHNAKKKKQTKLRQIKNK